MIAETAAFFMTTGQSIRISLSITLFLAADFIISRTMATTTTAATGSQNFAPLIPKPPKHIAYTILHPIESIEALRRPHILDESSTFKVYLARLVVVTHAVGLGLIRAWLHDAD